MIEMKPQETRRIARIVKDLTLFDDDLMSKVFDNNIEAAQLIIRIILSRDDLNVISVQGQRELKNPIVEGRNIRLDVLAEDSTGKYYDIEVQRSNEGAHFRRARFHSSMLDVRMLKEKEKFAALNDSYVIFITEHDIIGLGLPVYHIRRQIVESEKAFPDGSNIIYVNGQYTGNDAYGKLMHDFKCTKYDRMYYSELSEGVRHFKETQGGQNNMCDALKEYAEEYAKEYAKECTEEKDKSNAVNLRKFGMDIDMIAKALERDPFTVRKWLETSPV